MHFDLTSAYSFSLLYNISLCKYKKMHFLLSYSCYLGCFGPSMNSNSMNIYFNVPLYICARFTLAYVTKSRMAES